MTPGPTRVPDRVLAAGARAMIHHRAPEFSRVLVGMMEGLQPVFGTREPVLPVHTTGRGAMEAAICNLLSPGDRIAVCCNGKFGEMWAGFAESHGVTVHRIAADWDHNVDPRDVDRAIDEHGVRAVLVAYCDTANGVRNDIASIGRITRARDVLLLVDGVSAIGGMPFAFDEWGVDFAVTASQKCLMSSPGLSFVVLGERAWAVSSAARLPRNYWDFADIRRHVTRAKPETPGTTPVHLVFQVAEAVAMIHEEGLERVYQRHDEMAAATREGAGALGLGLQCPGLTGFSATVTAISAPAGVEPRTIRDGLKRRGILTAAGLGRFEGSGFRIGHMGDIRPADVALALSALREVLSEAAAPAR